MIEPSEARRHVLDRCRRLRPRRVPLADATGLVLAEDVVAAEDVPPFANTAVDGYAVRAADVAGAPVELPRRRRGRRRRVPARVTVGAGEAIRIMTGAPMPAGADAVVMVEDTERARRRRACPRPPRRRRGRRGARASATTSRAGTRCSRPATVVTPAVAGVLASINVREPLGRVAGRAWRCCRPATS